MAQIVSVRVKSGLSDSQTYSTPQAEEERRPGVRTLTESPYKSGPSLSWDTAPLFLIHPNLAT